MKEHQVSIMFSNEEYELLMKEAGKRQALTGKKTFLTTIIREQIEPYLVSLRNGNVPPTKQESKQDNEQEPTKDKDPFDFTDLEV